VVGDRRKIERLFDALRYTVRQADRFALGEPVSLMRVVHRVAKNIGVERIGCVQMQLAE
jgi:hypothetical protein